MQIQLGSTVPLFLRTKNRPCKCHPCVKIECHLCKARVFQTVEKMEIFNREKKRAYNLCPDCMKNLEKDEKFRITDVDIDKTAGSVQ